MKVFGNNLLAAFLFAKHDMFGEKSCVRLVVYATYKKI